MKTLRDTIMQWTDKRLREMLAAPRAWGSDEAIEAQVLLLLQFRMLTLHPEFDNGDPGSLVDDYMNYLARAYPENPHQPLHQIVPTDRLGLNIAKELKKVIDVFKKNMGQEKAVARDIPATTSPAPQSGKPAGATFRGLPVAPPRMGGSMHAGVRP